MPSLPSKKRLSPWGSFSLYSHQARANLSVGRESLELCLGVITSQQILKGFSLTAQEITCPTSSAVICVLCECMIEVKQESQCLSLAQGDLGVISRAQTPPIHVRIIHGHSLVPQHQKVEVNSLLQHCTSFFTHSKDDGERKCFFCCKILSVSGTPVPAKAHVFNICQIIEKLLDKEVLLLK